MFPSLMGVAALLFGCCLSLASIFLHISCFLFLAGMSGSSVARLYTAQRRLAQVPSHQSASRRWVDCVGMFVDLYSLSPVRLLTNYLVFCIQPPLDIHRTYAFCLSFLSHCEFGGRCTLVTDTATVQHMSGTKERVAKFCPKLVWSCVLLRTCGKRARRSARRFSRERVIAMSCEIRTMRGVHLTSCGSCPSRCWFAGSDGCSSPCQQSLSPAIRSGGTLETTGRL